MISLNDVLLVMSNIPVDDPIAEIWGRELQGGYKIIKYTGALPITINADGNALIDYRIYGTSGGVGEPTENLYNWRTDTKYSYINAQGSIWRSGTSDNKVSDKIPVVGGKTYLLVNPIAVYGTGLYAVFYNANNAALSSTLLSLNTASYTLEAPPEAAYFRTSLKRKDDKNDVTMFIEGSTAPTDYIPYGYKLPMTVSVNYEYVFTGNESFSNSYGRYQFSLPKAAIKKSNASNTSCSHFPYGTGLSDSGTFSFEIGRFAYFGVRNEYPTITDFKQFLTDQYNAGTPMRLKYFLAPSDFPIYIGENQLDVGEYVSFSEQKIYREVSGTLTPTYPPVSFPDIPTIKGETIIDYDGTPKPSQMYVKYKGKG